MLRSRRGSQAWPRVQDRGTHHPPTRQLPEAAALPEPPDRSGETFVAANAFRFVVLMRGRVNGRLRPFLQLAASHNCITFPILSPPPPRLVSIWVDKVGSGSTSLTLPARQRERVDCARLGLFRLRPRRRGASRSFPAIVGGQSRLSVSQPRSRWPVLRVAEGMADNCQANAAPAELGRGGVLLPIKVGSGRSRRTGVPRLRSGCSAAGTAAARLPSG